MSKISTYEVAPVPKLSDKLIGTSVGGEIEDVTYNFTLQELLDVFLPVIPANNLQGILDYGNTATQDINLFGTITTTNLDVTDTANLFITYLNEETHIVGSLFDSADSIGTAGQVLTSTGDGVEWFTLPPIFTPNLQQVLEEGNTADLDIILDADLEAINITADTANIATQLSIQGVVVDYNESAGTAGQVLESTVTGVQWTNLPVYSATSPLLFNSGTNTFSIQVANSTQGGYLTASDWVTFDGKQNAGAYITALTGEATATGPGSVPITLNNASVIAKVLTGLNVTGGSISASDSILTAFGKVQNQINGLIGGVQYQGTWNAATNTPTLTSSVGTQGHFYIVSVAGNTDLNGITDWKIGDWAIFSGGAWSKVDNTESVTSVNGQIGAVSLTTDDIPEGATNLYYLDSRARGALSFAAGSGAYNSLTGVITIPTNNNQILNGANYITLGSLSASSPLVYNNLTGAFSIPQATALVDGYLSATDWSTFNNKQNYLGGTGLVKSTAGTITYITDNSGNWNTAYDRSIVSAAVTGTTTKTLTLTEQDGNTIQASWTDLDTGLTSVGVSMPAAFSVANSPLTSNGTIAITGAGTTLQYIDGTGALQTFPGLTGFVPYTGATTNVDLGEFGISAGYFQADLTPTGALQVGRMQWNSTDGTMDLRLMGNNVTLQIGQENVTRVVNKTGIDLLEANYQVVRVRKVAEGGAQGQRLAVVLAQGNNENNSTEVLGLVTETINANQEGFVTAFGEVKNINTTGSLQGETWVDGDILYVSTSVAGQLTNIRPVAPNHAVTVGYVTYAHANNGKIYMAIDTGYELGELHNVYAPSPTANQSIYWNTTNSRYELNTIGGILGYTPANAATTISTTAPLQGGGNLSANRTFSITQAGAASDGYLSSTDWNTFNNKQPAGSYVPTSRLLSINGTQYDLSADRSWSVGTVTSVAALTLGTSGTDLSSSVANGTTTPVITLNVPTASAANRGALSAADWSTFNTKVGNVTASSPLASSGGSTPNITIQQASGSQDGYLSSNDWTTFNNKQAAGNYITSLTGEATATGPGAASVTLNNAAVTGKVLTGVNITGGSISATDSILTAFGKVQNQINGLIGSTIYQGTWNASTNTPTLTSGVGTRGYYYIVSVAGSTNLDGITDWFVGDWAIFDGTAWQQVDNTDAVVSVNGFTGAVSLTTDNIPEGTTNQYFLNSRARAALSFAAGSGAYNSTTGVITIPTNNNQITNGSNYITLGSLSGSAPIVYNSGTGAISITQAGTACNGFLSSTDWNTFNNKTTCVGTVTCVAANGGGGISISGSPITTSGTFCITNTAPYSGEAVIVLGGGTCSSVRCGVANTASGQFSASLSGTSNNTSGYGSLIAGGYGNTSSGSYASTIAGGEGNVANVNHATIVGGLNNSASASMTFIGAGKSNTASGACSFVGGGCGNTNSGAWSFLGGGRTNTLSGYSSSLSGGYNNKACGNYSTISGGYNNTTCNSFSGVVGGHSNVAIGTYSFVGGGQCNTASNNHSAVGGGISNIASSACSTVAGGQGNAASGTYSIMGGGLSNSVSGNSSFVGGGRFNTASGNCSFVGGGCTNTASGAYSMIGGGQANCTTAPYTVVVGGDQNAATQYRAFIGGGYDNTSSGYYSVVVGGYQNSATSFAFVGSGRANSASGGVSTIGGGQNNTASSGCATIGGGFTSTASGSASTVSGGQLNIASGNCSTVSGGDNNTASNNRAKVGGGTGNTASAQYSTIGGGIANYATAYASTISGGYGNNNYSNSGTIGGGSCNRICNSLNSTCTAGATIAGGAGNNSSGGTWNDAGYFTTAPSTFYAAGKFSFIGGGFQNRATDYTDVVSGGFCNITCGGFGAVGGGRCNTASGTRATIAGGESNIASSSWAFVGGGISNTASAYRSTVSGGNTNAASGNRGAIVGGSLNIASGTQAFIGGGASNTASNSYSVVAGGYASTASGSYSFIGAGSINGVAGNCGAIVGGKANAASGNISFIGGGCSNTASGLLSVIAGGRNNCASGESNSIGGGQNNCANGNFYATISGGLNNTASQYSSSIGGGQSNTASGYRAKIGGGISNAASGNCATIGGGQGNTASAGHASVLGGQFNTATSGHSIVGGGLQNSAAAGCSGTFSGRYNCTTQGFAFVGGGCLNTACAGWSFIGGGANNRVSAVYGAVAGGNNNKVCGASYGFIGGGEVNTASGNYYATIAGGSSNTASATLSFVGGGVLNAASAACSTIGGGANNIASGGWSFLGGGQGNTASGTCSFIGGGRGNTSSAVHSVVVGGQTNSATANFSFIGNGYANVACSVYATIGGGALNTSSGRYTTLSGGYCNTIYHSVNDLCNLGAAVGGGVGNNTTGGTWAGAGFSVAPTKVNTGCFSFVGGGFQNRAGGKAASILGGINNSASGYYSMILGGRSNVATGDDSAVMGGRLNTASGTRAVVGGDSNIASNTYSAIVGGYINTSSGYASFVGGGKCNRALANSSTVSGGYCNVANNSNSTVSGGYRSTASGSRSTVGGGNTNTASGTNAAVLGGSCNTASGSQAFVGAGISNTASGYDSFVGGGLSNGATSSYATVSGGYGNSASAPWTTVSGGKYNVATGTHSTIAGGQNNTASGACSFVGGGLSNTANNGWTTIAGGVGNTASGYLATISGGDGNAASGGRSFIGGGNGNTASNTRATIGGGLTNTASGYLSTIVGGQTNTASGTSSFVGGGYNNIASTTYSAIVGGEGNRACCQNYTFVGGGLNNIANSCFSSVLAGLCNSTNSATNAHIIGSCIPAVANNFTFVNNLCQWGGGISDGRRKNTIQDTCFGLDDIIKLRPVSYCWNGDRSCHKKYGFIAQEVQQAMSCVVETNPIARVDENGLEVITEQGGSPILQFEKDAIYASYVNAFKEISDELKSIKNILKNNNLA